MTRVREALRSGATGVTALDGAPPRVAPRMFDPDDAPGLAHAYREVMGDRPRPRVDRSPTPTHPEHTTTPEGGP